MMLSITSIRTLMFLYVTSMTSLKIDNHFLFLPMFLGAIIDYLFPLTCVVKSKSPRLMIGRHFVMDLVWIIVKIYQVDHIINWIECQICNLVELLGSSKTKSSPHNYCINEQGARKCSYYYLLASCKFHL